ncbi:MAG: amidohydrolase family protein [Bacteroidota bacterium]
MRVDSHIHLWQFDQEEYDWITDELAAIRDSFTPEDLLPFHEELKIDGFVAVQARQNDKENTFLLNYANEHAHVLGVVGWVDLQSGNVKAEIERLKQDSYLKGLRHIIQSEPDGFMTQPTFIEGVKLLRDLDLCYDLLIYENQLPEANKFMKKIHDDQKVVLDHIAKPKIKDAEIVDWRKGIKSLAKHENLYCKVSGMVTEADWQNWQYEDFKPYIDVIFEAFGPDRILYGSDWPVCLLSSPYQKVFSILDQYLKPFDVEVRDKVMGENAASFYNL